MPCTCGQHKTPQGCAGSRNLIRLNTRPRPKKPRGPRVYYRTGPLCQCGCGKRCAKHATWATPECVPQAVKVNAMRAGWVKVSQRHRAIRFKADIDRLLVTGKVSREDLIAFAHELWERGYHAAVQRERRRQKEAA